MNDQKMDYQNIDQYIQSFPDDVQAILQRIRQVIRQAAPDAEECMSYKMPTFKLHGNLVHFAGYKNHIGFYPAPSGIEKFVSKITRYKHAKGSLRFPLNEPIPYEMIAEVVKFRVHEHLQKSQSKDIPKTSS